ncbi:MAG: MMPL family transporter [bacterium]|nr:MMPL family transporter [bacterium]MDE0240824.1 MMPL family transporter [bacterium]
MTGIVESFIETVLRRRWPVLALMALVMVALTAGVIFVGVTNDYRSLFDEDNPQLESLNVLEATYGTSNRALIAVAPQSGSVFNRAALGAIEDLTEAAWQTPYSTRVDSLSNHSHSWADGDDLTVQSLVEDADTLTDADVEWIRDVALNTPEIAGRLVSHDGAVAGLVIDFALPENPDAAVFEITDQLHHLLDRARASNPDIAYYLTGDVPLNRAFADATRDDMETLVPIVFAIIAGVAAFLLRSVVGTLAIVVVLMFTVNTTVGFAGWLGIVFNPANSGVPIIVMTVAVAHSVHIVEKVLAGIGRGLDRNAAIAESIRINAWPVFLTSLTTVIGFLSLNASDSPPFRVLGNLVAFGVFCAFVYSMTVLPAVLSVLPMRARPVRARMPDVFDRLGEFVVARRTALLWGSAVVAIVLVTGVPRLELTDNWTSYLSERYQFRQDTDFVIENLTGIESLEYSLESGRDGGITEPAYLRNVEAFANWFREQPEVLHVEAFPDIMKRLNKNMHGDDPAYYVLPDDPELSAQYLLLYELSLPFGRDLNNRINVAKSATRMTVVMRDLTSQAQRELDARAQEWIRGRAPDLASEASGVSIIFAHLSQRNIVSMLTGTIIAMALISLILVFIFRSLRVGLVSVVPNFIPAAMSLGLWGYAVGNVGLAGSVMTAIAFGIVVDDTIHFLTKYHRARHDGLDAPEAVRAAFRTVGHALLTTTVVLVLGFLVFASSGFEVSWALGLLVSLTISFALLADFLFLPPLLMLLDRRKS